MPERVQLSRKKGWRMPENTVKVTRGRGSAGAFGNPFPVTKGTSTAMGETSPVWCVGTWDGPAMWFKPTKAEATQLAVDAYREWIKQPAQARLLGQAQRQLRGRNLACWCKIGAPCHADVLLEQANGPVCEPA